MIIIEGILVLYIYKTRLASNETFSPSNKIHREVGRAEDLSALWYNELGNVGQKWFSSYFWSKAKTPVQLSPQ
jgi:hypothetical protein